MIGKQTPAVFHLAEEMQARAAELSAQAGRPVEGFEVFVHNPAAASRKPANGPTAARTAACARST